MFFVWSLKMSGNFNSKCSNYTTFIFHHKKYNLKPPKKQWENVKKIQHLIEYLPLFWLSVELMDKISHSQCSFLWSNSNVLSTSSFQLTNQNHLTKWNHEVLLSFERKRNLFLTRWHKSTQTNIIQCFHFSIITQAIIWMTQAMLFWIGCGYKMNWNLFIFNQPDIP